MDVDMSKTETVPGQNGRPGDARQQAESVLAELLTAEEAAAQIEVGVKILDHLVADGRISPVGKSNMFLPEDVERVCEERRAQVRALTDQLYSSEQAAEALGVSLSYVRTLTRRGDLTPVVSQALELEKGNIYLREDVEILAESRAHA